MKSLFFAIAVVPISLLALFGIYTLVLVLKVNAGSEVEGAAIPACAKKEVAELLELFANADGDSILEEFPYEQLLEEGCLPDLAGIAATMSGLRAQLPSSAVMIDQVYQRLLTVALHRIQQPDRSNFTEWVRWAASFKTAQGVLEADLARTFRAVHFYWFSQINGYLGEWVAEDPAFKYRFDYRFAEKIMAGDKFYLSTGKTALEKIIQYLSEQRYAYLFSRFWHGTGAGFKLGLILGGLLLFGGSIYLFKKLFHK